MSFGSRSVRSGFFAVALTSVLTVAPALAQGVTNLDLPIGRFVLDAHSAVVPIGRNFQLAAARGLDPEVDPRLGIGGGGGVHLYPFRVGVLTVGVGGRAIAAAATGSPDPEGENPTGPQLLKRFTAYSGELSLNFGGRDGWSYVSGGMGRSRLSLYASDTDEPPQRSTHTVSVGGGARWFTSQHLAFAIDLRFYTMRPLEATVTEPASPRVTVMVLSIGTSFK